MIPCLVVFRLAFVYKDQDCVHLLFEKDFKKILYTKIRFITDMLLRYFIN